MRIKPVFLALALLFLGACSNSYEEVARFSPGEVTTLQGQYFIAEDQMELDSNSQFQVWIDLDYSFEGEEMNEGELFFRFVILKDEKYLREFYVYPSKIEDLEVAFHENKNGQTEMRYFGNSGNLALKGAGYYDFKVILMGSRNPSLTIRKADLFLKQKG